MRKYILTFAVLLLTSPAAGFAQGTCTELPCLGTATADSAGTYSVTVDSATLRVDVDGEATTVYEDGDLIARRRGGAPVMLRLYVYRNSLEIKYKQGYTGPFRTLTEVQIGEAGEAVYTGRLKVEALGR